MSIRTKLNKIETANRRDLIAAHKLSIDLFFEEIGKRETLCAREKAYFLERLNRAATAILFLS